MLAFDIETYADWDALSPAVRDYLARRERGRSVEDARSRAAGTVGLRPGLAGVIAVGLWGGEGDTARLFLDPSSPTGVHRAHDEQGEIVRCRSEAELLREFWDRVGARVAQGSRLVSFNGRGFDGPILMLRSAVLGLRPSVYLAGRRSLRPHCDLLDVLGFFGASRGTYGLDYWCHVFGVPSPKGELDGAGVAAAYERGEVETIGRYALGDARATGELFRRLEGTLLPLLEEAAGPAFPPVAEPGP